MANELTLAVGWNFSKNSIAVPMSVTKQVTISGDLCNKLSQSIGTGGKEVLPLGEITTPRYFVACNRDSTNTVDIYPNGTDPSAVTLGPGQPCLIPLSSAWTAPQAQATGGACLLEYCFSPT